MNAACIEIPAGSGKVVDGVTAVRSKKAVETTKANKKS
jgi:hypothetical protein